MYLYPVCYYKEPGNITSSLAWSHSFYERWKHSELRLSESQGFTLEEVQLRQDWEVMVAVADQTGRALEQIHVFALAHILRRPIIVYGVRLVKNYRGENLGYANFEGNLFSY